MKSWTRQIHKPLSRFSARLFALIVVTIILPFTLVTFYVAWHMEEGMKESISQRVFQNMQRSGGFIAQSLQDMAYYSNVFVSDERLKELLASDDASIYEISKHFDSLIARVSFENPDGIRTEAKVVIMDNHGRIVSNWSLNYNDYGFLLDEDWVRESRENDGHIVWSIFSPAYIQGEEGSYISLARSILSDTTSGKMLGTLIISIAQGQFEDIVRQYAYEGDEVFILIEDGRLLMSSSASGAIDPDMLGQLCTRFGEREQGNSLVESPSGRFLLSFYIIPAPWLFDGMRMKVFHFTPYGQVEEEVASVVGLIRIVILASLAMVLLLSFSLSRLVVRPLTNLTHQLRDYRIGMKFTGLDVKRQDEIGDLNRGIVRMNTRLERLFARVQEEHEAREHYYYESLRAQLNPHYIFNTLGTIRWMAMARSADNIVSAIDNLSSTLRYSMGKENVVTLRDEIDHIRNYIYIHNLRYDEFVDLVIEVPEDLMGMKMMKFILQPIVENSIIHGFDRQRGMIVITIGAEVVADRLLIRILDDGVGIGSEALERMQDGGRKPEKGRRLTGIGLGNVDRSIRVQYGKGYGVEVSRRTDTHGTLALFTLPVLKEEG